MGGHQDILVSEQQHPYRLRIASLLAANVQAFAERPSLTGWFLSTANQAQALLRNRWAGWRSYF
jgi:hypothetical protein